MSLTAKDLLDEVRSATNRAEGSTFVSQASIVNQALLAVNRMHKWEGMLRGSVDVAGVAGQEYIDLPANCREIINLANSGAYTTIFTWTDLATIDNYRLSGLDPDPAATTAYYGALAQREGATGLVKVVQTYPNTSTTAPDYWKLTYRAKIMPVNVGTDSDTQYMMTPDYMEDLIRAVVRAYAYGIEEETVAPLEARMHEILQSDWLRDVKTEDAGSQPELGSMEGGAAMAERLWGGEEYWDMGDMNIVVPT